jgi:predicted MFS family arabinose efflux permease
VVGIALALKMVVYVFGAPLITALAARLARRRLLVTLDLLRAGGVAAMPVVTEVWQVYALIVLINACSAGFTPTLQATIPDVRRSGSAAQRPALFAAQFSLSHACWLATYPIAGVLGSTLGLHPTAWLLAALAAAALALSALAWPAPDQQPRPTPKTATPPSGFRATPSADDPSPA